jgi:dephospho-CoA kinase
MKIGLVGYARTGKDTICQMIEDYFRVYGHGRTKQLAFGDELKRRFFTAFPEAKHGNKPREAYEKFGELGRHINKNFWINPVKDELTLMSNFYENFVVTDCRQPNEAQFLKDNGFILIKVWTPEHIRKERSNGDTNWKPVNDSERLLNDIKCDHIIFNMFDIENTKDQLIYIIEKGILKNGNY